MSEKFTKTAKFTKIINTAKQNLRNVRGKTTAPDTKKTEKKHHTTKKPHRRTSPKQKKTVDSRQKTPEKNRKPRLHKKPAAPGKTQDAFRPRIPVVGIYHYSLINTDKKSKIKKNS